MSTLRPILAVADVDVALAFYRDKLGFDEQFSLQDQNDRTFFASASLAESSILLTLEQPLDVAIDIRHLVRADMPISIQLPDETDLDEFYAELRAKGVTIHEEIADKFWGSREFTIRDPNGYLIIFSMPTQEVSIETAKEISSGLDISSTDQDV